MSAPTMSEAGLAAVDYDPFAGEALSRVVPTTEPQREVWLADRLGREASLAYNESVSLRFSGTFDVAAMVRALADLADRHDALRAVVSTDGETLLIKDALSLDVRVKDLSALDRLTRDAAVAEARRDAVETPFDVNGGPLFRTEILRLEADAHLVIMTAHHIVCDGWSFGVLVRDLASLYAKALGRPVTELPRAASYAEYALAQHAAAGNDANQADEAYWLQQFKERPPALDLPTDRPRAAWRTFRSRREDFILDTELVAAVRKSGARAGASLFATLLAGFAATLRRIAATDEIVIGVSAAGQSVGGHDQLVGHCVNMLPVRLVANTAASATELVTAAQTATLDAYEHQQYTFGTLLKKLSLARDPSRLPLVSVVFNVDQALDPNTVGFPDVAVEFESNPRSFENFEMFVNAVHVREGLRLECQYNADLFDQATIQRWLRLYRDALTRFAADPATTAHALTAPSDEDLAWLARWNDTGRAYETGLRLGDLLMRGLRRSDTATAVVFEREGVSHAALGDRAWALALHLRALGVRPGTLVGVCLERSVDLVAALTGVVFSGGAYVPLDPTYPIERLSRMREDAELTVVVSRRAEYERVKDALPATVRVVLLDEVEIPPAAAADRLLVGREDDPAYVIFTSGSTGRPKGAMNAHRGIVNRLFWMQEAYALAPGDRVMQKTPYSFDVSVWEFFWPLMTGAAIVVAKPEGHRDGAYMIELVRSQGVTVMHFVPSMLRILLDEPGLEHCTGLRQVVCSGEALSFDVVEAFFRRLPATRLANLYGPTEAAVDVTAWDCVPGEPSRIVPIGRPIANTQMHVLDDKLVPVPVGVVGELYIGGVQVGMGYVSRPDLTAERFLADPFRAHGRLYKTGDIGRWRMNGAIEYLGRADHQVKIRGNRIELGEIEAHLLATGQVARAVVMAREDKPGDVRLVAYFVSALDTRPSDEALKAALKAVVPEYMVPQHFVALTEIPLLTNGKVDRKALPVPDPSARDAADFVAPRGALEQAVAAEMEKSLGLPGIGAHDDFFALGGHSLLAAQLTSRLNRAFDSHLSMRSLFEAPTVAGLAALIENQRQAPAVARKTIAPLADRTRAPASLMQERLWFLEELHPGRVNYHAPSAHRLKGPLNESAFEQAFREMVRRQPVLRTSFERHDGVVTQRIHDEVAISLFPAEDLSALAAHEQDTVLRQRLDDLTAETFDLAQAPLFRVKLFRLGPEEHALFFMPHHIIWDGWSFDLFYEEMSSLYAAYTHGGEHGLPALSITYGDFSAWHRDWVQGEDFARQVAFWRERLVEIGKAQALPTDKPRRPGMSGAGSTEWILLDKAKTDALHGLARDADATLFITLLAAYAVLLHAYSRQTNLVIGTPVRGRNAVELENIMGYFNNLLPLQFALRPDEPFAAFVKRVKAVVMESLAYPDVPLEQLSQTLSVTRETGGSLLYQALFSFQDARQRVTRWGALQHESILIFQRGATEDLGMWFVESTAGLHGGVTYNTDILSSATVQQLRKGFLTMLDAVVAKPGMTVAELGAALAPRTAAAGTAAPRTVAALPASPTSPPATGSEKALAEIWARELKLPVASISTTDNFFDLGGHSLLAMQVMNAMEQTTGKRVNPRRFIFESLGQIAQGYDEAQAAQTQAAGRHGGLKRLLSRLVGAKDA